MAASEAVQPAREPQQISPTLALDLRIRFLETLLRAPPHSSSPNSSPASLARRVAHVHEALQQALETPQGGTDAVRRFVQNYELNSPLLTPALPSAPPEPDAPTSSASKLALVLEAEHDLRTLERDLRELAVLDERGVVGAGQLADHEALRPTLDDVVTKVKPVAKEYVSLEQRTTALLQGYNDYISTMSELFVSWDEILGEAEAQVARLEKQKRRENEYDVS
ncbi:hypothetical protein Rhopal_001745-T1 [Rhodotorula paludigena]|uniref:Dynactin subunit 3 n=1 Tax=Rhodotorula paludigena TaxID=86838 RepID=A0AAV5G881_9BASI|nr:hypothetical protein Rhopal_001745-T1 [Rhodotorula paludigena]